MCVDDAVVMVSAVVLSEVVGMVVEVSVCGFRSYSC